MLTFAQFALEGSTCNVLWGFPEGKYIGIGRAGTQRVTKRRREEQEMSKKQAPPQQAQVQRGLWIKNVTTQYVWSMPRRILDVERCRAYMQHSGREEKKIRLVNTDRGGGGGGVKIYRIRGKKRGGWWSWSSLMAPIAPHAILFWRCLTLPHIIIIIIKLCCSWGEKYFLSPVTSRIQIYSTTKAKFTEVKDRRAASLKSGPEWPQRLLVR